MQIAYNRMKQLRLYYLLLDRHRESERKMKSSSRSMSFKSSTKKKKKNEMILSTSKSKSFPSTSTDGVVYMRSYLGTGSFHVPDSLVSFSIGEEDDGTTTEQHIRLRDDRDDVEELSSSYENHITRTAVTVAPPLIMRPSDESEREEVLKVSS